MDNKFVKGYCNKHYQQVMKYGKIFEHTRMDRNEYKVCKDYTKIVFRNQQQEPIGYAIIDTSMIEKCRPYKWYISYYGYVWSKTGGRLHALICGVDSMIDHKNLDKLDNRLDNLRIATYSENSMNRKVRSDSKSGYKGVARQSQYSFQTRVSKYFVGTYYTPQEAAWMYDQFASQLHGEFARTNFEYF